MQSWAAYTSKTLLEKGTSKCDTSPVLNTLFSVTEISVVLHGIF